MSVLHEWKREVHGIPPFGHMLRARLHDHWVRAHSLPEGKRYATDTAEQRMLMRRHAWVASVVLGVGAPCIAIRASWTSDSARWTHDDGHWTPENLAGWSASEDELETLATVRWETRRLEWSPGALDAEVADVAEDRGRLCVLSRGSGGIYAPYDGGADLFLRSPEHVARLAGLLDDWAARPL